MASTSSVNGIASGIQWQDLVDQIMKAETSRALDVVSARKAKVSQAADSWGKFQTLAATLRDAAATLRAPDAFNVFSATAAKTPDGTTLLTASSGATADPGAYSVEVLATARAEKLGSAAFSTTGTALGISGSFALNGKAITVSATDSLATLRDRINIVNSGTAPSGVTATILTTAAGSRLVLTSDTTGASGIETVDGGTGTLAALGLSDGTSAANIADNGATQTQRLSSATGGVGSLLGITVPAATTIKVGGQTIAVDLSLDSLTTLADKINTATGNASAATVVTETQGGRTTYRLQTDAAVEADSGDAVASARALAVLGFTRTGRGGAAQTLKSATTFGDALTGLTADTTAKLTDLKANGQSLGLSAGDVITIGGTQGNGTAVARTFTVGAASTLQDLLTAINDGSTGFGAGARPATASLSGGRVVLTDGTSGDSRLALSLSVAKAGGGTISLGSFSTANGGTVGRSTLLSAGADAVISVDGQVVRRSSNSIADAISGVTLDLQTAMVGTPVTVTVARNTDQIVSSMNAFVSAYNAVRTFVNKEASSGGTLANDSSIRSMSASITAQLLQNVPGIGGSYTTASLVGLTHDKAGVLSLDSSAFTKLIGTNFSDVQKLFTLAGTTTDNELSFVSAGSDTKVTGTSPYAVVITQAATLASVTGSTWSTYATTGTADTMAITDTATGLTGSVALANGDTIAQVVARLNTVFATQKMHLSASVASGNKLKLDSTDYGTGGGFTVAYTPGTGGDGTAALGITAQAYTGLNVAGTINGAAGTGSGQYLTAAAGNDAAAAIVRYTGSTARAAGTLAITRGVAGLIEKVATALAATNDGAAATQKTAATATSDALAKRVTEIQSRLDLRRAALTKQFIAMESAMSKTQALGTALTSQINALNPKSN
jgi:flagellar hook-associated protein 2